MTRPLTIARKTGGAVCALGTAVAVGVFFFTDAGEVPVVGYAWLGLIALAPLLLLWKALGAQLLGRAALWANLIFGTLICLIGVGSSYMELSPLLLVLAAGFGLLILGTSGLEAPDPKSSFVPKAFRGCLVAIIVMALSDTVTLLFWGGLVTELDHQTHRMLLTAPFMLGAGLVMALAVVGLVRLRTWGFLLNVAANVIIAGGSWLLPDLPNAIRICLSATAVAQVLVALPLLRAIIKGSQPETPMNTRRVGLVSSGIIVTLMAVVLITQLAF